MSLALVIPTTNLGFHAMCVSDETYCCGCVIVAVVALERQLTQLSIMSSFSWPSPGKAHIAKV